MSCQATDQAGKRAAIKLMVGLSQGAALSPGTAVRNPLEIMLSPSGDISGTTNVALQLQPLF